MSLGQLKVMSAIETCRTAALGGHVARCEECAHTRIAYNSCRNRHCPKCQGAAAKEWLAEREAELLPVPYYHVVFTLPAPIADIAYQNKAVIYDILFKAAAETLVTIAADPKHLGARIGLTAVLHSWGSALTHHPHVHIIVPGGGISLDGQRWISCRPGFFLPVRVLSRLFRRLLLEKLVAAHDAGRLQFFGAHVHLAERTNSRLVALDDTGVTFSWKDYRAKGRGRPKVMTLAIDEFIRRFLIHVLPDGFHRIRHYGLFAKGGRAENKNIARARQLLNVMAPRSEPSDAGDADASEPQTLAHPCPCCGGRMIIIETFERGGAPRYRPTVPIGIDSS